jgi:hypothetical protein
MGTRSDTQHEAIMNEAANGPIVAAAPGYFSLDCRWPDSAPESVLAWRVGSEVVLPVTRWGCDTEEHFVIHPDGTVRPHFPMFGSEVPTYKSLEEWRKDFREGGETWQPPAYQVHRRA